LTSSVAATARSSLKLLACSHPVQATCNKYCVLEGRSLQSALFRACHSLNPTISGPGQRWHIGLLLSLIFSGDATAAHKSASAASQAQSCFGELQQERARIQRVSDGDTVVLSDKRRVRLIGINTAELNAQDTRLRRAAELATERLENLLPPNEPVVLFIGAEPRDRHGRVLAHVVRKKDGLAVAPLLLREGLAVQSAVAPNTRCATDFAALEQQAVNDKLGEWGKLALLGKRARDFTGNERGFHLVTGTVTHTSSKKRFTEVILDGTFRLQLRPALARLFYGCSMSPTYAYWATKPCCI